MRRSLLPSTLLSLGAALPLVTPTAAQDAERPVPAGPPQVGQPMPDLVLPTVDGTQTIALSQFRGQKVFLVVFASW